MDLRNNNKILTLTSKFHKLIQQEQRLKTLNTTKQDFVISKHQGTQGINHLNNRAVSID